MKFIVATILTALLAFISGLYLPWWGIAPVALAVAALIPQRPGVAFLAGFTGLFLLWAGLAFWTDEQNQGILSQKIARILPLGGRGLLLVLITGFVGGLVGGLAALTGSFLRNKPSKARGA